MIYLDPKTGCYTDGKNYVRARQIRLYAAQNMGVKTSKGKLPRDVIAAYFLDVFNVNEQVAS
jgi:hypothetical protein